VEERKKKEIGARALRNGGAELMSDFDDCGSRKPSQPSWLDNTGPNRGRDHLQVALASGVIGTSRICTGVERA